MEMVQIVAIGLIGAILAMVVGQSQKEIGMLIGMATGLILFFIIAAKLLAVMDTVSAMVQQYNIHTASIAMVFKIIGISYLGEFAISTLKDAGQSGIASKVELCTKVMILALSLPVLKSLLETVTRVLP